MRLTPYIIIACILLTWTAVAQNKGRVPNKAFRDSVFEKGDIIQIPVLSYALSYPILPETRDSLKLVAEFLKKHPALKVEIGCHTDSRGSVEMNNRLSAFRASSVRDVLVIEMGIDAGRITCTGYGETLPILADPVSKNASPEEKEKIYSVNRRTELKVIDIIQ